MTSTPPLRWGLLGCANVLRWAIVPGLRRSKLGSAVAIGSRDPSKARAWARELRIPRAHGSYQALVDDPQVDAIYIGLPNHLHHPWTLAASEAGKHVLCEKPMAMDAGQAAEMAEACRARGVVLREGFMWRHQPRTLEVSRRLRDGAIGELRSIRVAFSYVMNDQSWRLDPASGGGALFDVGCYGVNLSRLFSGEEPAEVRAVARWGPSGVALAVAAALRFPGGVLASIDVAYDQPARNSYELVGSNGIIEVPDAFVPPRRPVAYLTVGGRRRTLRFGRSDQYAEMFDDFARAVAAPTSGDDVGAQMAALDAIRAEIRPGSPSA